MITHITIKNFKSHSETSLSLSCLNILTGLNSVGKSSVFQALLLLRQSYLKNRLHEGIDLNKPLCNIGLVGDARYQYASDDVIEFGIEIDQQQNLCWQFQSNELDSTFLKLANKPAHSHLNQISLFNRKFQYLSAARLAPQESYPKDSYSVEKERQISNELGKCELIAHFLYYYGRSEQIKFENLKYPQSHNDLLSQTNAWFREISPNDNVIVKDNKINFEMKYQFNLENNQLSTNEFKAENVGFGISYALPIIVAVLAAEKDSILFIENPESHLHPQGQAKLAELMALAAQNGVQIFIETHSEHIINGTLVAVKKYQSEQRGIAHDKVRIYYFERDETHHATQSIEVPVLEGGRITYPPRGFFDQFKKDIKTLMGF
jgi:predicted ATPase